MKRNVMTETEEKIKQILISDLEIEPQRLAACESSTPLLGRGVGLDSVETLTLVVGIEREFDIQILDDDLTPQLFKSIGNLAEYVSQKVVEQKSR